MAEIKDTCIFTAFLVEKSDIVTEMLEYEMVKPPSTIRLEPQNSKEITEPPCLIVMATGTCTRLYNTTYIVIIL